ncbi:hypothetical protein E4U41_004182 [Claviceps citrina]|nr:hypothetical protein E4U41_004182 [Claviceps citrina]
MSLELLKEAPNASLGEWVLGAARIWILRHCRHTKAALGWGRSPWAEEDLASSDGEPRIMAVGARRGKLCPVVLEEVVVVVMPTSRLEAQLQFHEARLAQTAFSDPRHRPC